MGRSHRLAAGNIVYHVLNRANRRVRIFHKPRDYDAFLNVLAEGLEVVPCRLPGLCLMPNHWHLVLWPHGDGDLSRLMAWITNTHVKRYRQHYHDKVGGHLCRLGVGLQAQPDKPDDIARMLTQVLVDPKFGQAAQDFARRYSAFDPGSENEQMVTRLVELVG